MRARDGFITKFDDPNAGTGAGQGTKVPSETGINPKGAIAGWYIDSNNVTHGYLRHPDGSFKTIDYPGAVYTNLAAIAPNGTIVGFFQDTSNVYYGFLRSANGKQLTQFDDSNAGTGANQGTLGYGINPAGTTMGIYIDASNVTHGFWLRGKKFHTLHVPEASGTFASTINNKRAITGNYLDKNNVSHGVLLTP